MGDRYHYGSDGSYRGRSSSEGPFSGIVYCVIIILVVMWLRGC